MEKTDKMLIRELTEEVENLQAIGARLDSTNSEQREYILLLQEELRRKNDIIKHVDTMLRAGDPRVAGVNLPNMTVN